MAPLVRRMTEADIADVAYIQVEAFGGNVDSRMRRLSEGGRYAWQDGWVVEMDGAVAAAAISIPATWWFAGASHPVSAISAVGVRAVARRRGFASELMRAVLQADGELGRPFSLLYPFQHGFYRRLGYATVGFTHFYRLPTAQLPDNRLLRERVRMVQPADYQAVYELYRWSLAHGAGGLERSAAQWNDRWISGDERWVIYATDDVEGYLVYQPVEDQLNITELVARTAAAERGLWAFAAAQVEQRQAITYHAPTDQPLWAMLNEPLMHDGRSRGFVLNDAATLTAGLMARLVDIPAACERRQVPRHLQGQVVFQLDDPVLAANRASFALCFEHGRLSAVPAQTTPEASCDIVTLSQLWCGVLRASSAVRQGHLHTSPETARLLDQLFASPGPFIHPADWF